jgi:phosphocarrier protein
MMVEKALTLKNPVGLHARPAAMFAKAAQGFASTIFVRCGAKEVNGKSLMSLLTLGAKKGASIILRAEGGDAEAAISTLSGLIESGLGETMEP